MKKNKMMRLASMLLVAVLLTTSVISGTFAKYTSQATVTDTARVAKWNIQFEVEGEDQHQMQNVEQSITVALWDHTDNNTLHTGDDDKKVIAPGTSGSFNYEFSNQSEVNAVYSITYTVENAGVPIEYSIDGGNNWTTGLANIEDAEFDIGASVATTIQWRWAYEGSLSVNYKDGQSVQTDVTDTNLGLVHTASPSVTIVFSATQVD